jgi:hypothetical protein
MHMQIDNQGRSTTRLRYRFSNVEQARAHLRAPEGRWLFFYRDEKLRLLPWAPVCLEFRFDDGTAPRPLHGCVMDSLEGSGTWIEIRDPRPILASSEYTRRSLRLGCDLPVEVRAEGGIATGRLLDLSTGGARITGISPFSTGRALELRLLSGDQLTFRDLSFGNVAWSQGSEMGVQFDAKDTVGRSAVARLLAEMEAQWHRAWESVHPLFCCKATGVMEPEPPRIPHADDVTGKMAR